MTHRIGIMGGDGIGPEVVAEGLKVIDALGIEYERIDYDLGGERYLKDGTVLPQAIIDEWRGIDALYAGAVGKVVATSASISLTVIAEAAFVLHELPDLMRTSLCASIFNAVIMYGVLK